MNDEAEKSPLDILRDGLKHSDGSVDLHPNVAVALVNMIDAKDDRIDTLRKERDEQEQAARVLRQSRDETLNQFTDLKERLHSAEIENARHEGYRQRVSEDDIARDGHEVVAVEDGAVIPRRPPTMFNTISAHEAYGNGQAMERDVYGRKPERRVHWVNYGR